MRVPSEANADSEGAPVSHFRTTNWNIIFSAADRNTPGGQLALARLCQTYWYPLYAFIRRSGRSPQDAEDLTQSFFAKLLENNFLEGIQREGGKFRSYLLVAVRHFLATQWERSQAQKRGGGMILLSLEQEATSRYRLEPADEISPERLFECRWAFTVLDEVANTLRSEYVRAGKAQLFAHLQPFLSGGPGGTPYSELAPSLGMTKEAVKVAVYRLRKRYGQLLREEIARTVGSPDEIQEEIRYLISVAAAFGYSFGGEKAAIDTTCAQDRPVP